jgi:hypothetical protein
MPVRLERPTLRRADEFLQAVRRSRKLHRGLVSATDSADRFLHYVKTAKRKSH